MEKNENGREKNNSGLRIMLRQAIITTPLVILGIFIFRYIGGQ